MTCHLHRAPPPPLPGFCRCGQRLPIGGWSHPECPRCRGRRGPGRPPDDPSPWYRSPEQSTTLGEALLGMLMAVLAVLGVAMLLYLGDG
jgi:hypothetical protein